GYVCHGRADAPEDDISTAESVHTPKTPAVPLRSPRRDAELAAPNVRIEITARTLRQTAVDEQSEHAAAPTSASPLGPSRLRCRGERAPAPVVRSPPCDRQPSAIHWVRTSAEYAALCLQTFRL